MEAAKAAYPIFIGRNLKADLVEQVVALRSESVQVAVVADAMARAAHKDFFEGELSSLPLIEIPSGETSKRMEWFAKVLDFLANSRLDRGGVLIAFGGGVVGDLAGFSAASYLRGIRFIQVPTTLLAMVDSSVGGKTGINIAAGKNLVGAFHQPIAVYADIDFLGTLPSGEFAAGMAEVVKYGMLADKALYDELEAEPLVSYGDARLEAVVQRCCQIKADVVKADERETAKSGGRALLNLGHTFAHAIENAAGYGEYLHGEAVAIGLACAARLSERLGHFTAVDVAGVEDVIAAQRLPIRLRKPLARKSLMAAMMRDKKVKSGALRFVAMRRIGDSITQGDIALEWVEAIWAEVGAQCD